MKILSENIREKLRASMHEKIRYENWQRSTVGIIVYNNAFFSIYLQLQVAAN